MKKCLLAGALLAFGAPILATAQCVAPKTPANDLVGSTYAFQITGTRVGAIGQFTALAGGYLSITETVVDTSGSTTNVINRTAPAWGRWLSNATCTGGQLQFMLNREFFTLNYTKGTGPAPGLQPILTLSGVDEWYLNALVPVQKFVLAGCKGPTPPQTGCTGLGPVGWAEPPSLGALTGTAWLNPPRACPASIGNPLNLLNGKTLPITYGGFASTMTFSFVPGSYSGNIVLTFNPVPFTRTSVDPPVNYPLYGRYIIYPDCSGGEFLIMGLGRGFPTPLGAPNFTQFEFIFFEPTFTQFRALADALL